MKKRIVYIIFVVALLLSGCGVKVGYRDNGLFDGVAPENGALFFYAYDGETTVRRTMYDTSMEISIFDEMRKVEARKVENWSASDIKTPIYGIETCWDGVGSFKAAWSNGYWITKTGEVFEFDYNFETLLEYGDWDSEETYTGMTAMPCAAFFAKNGNAWNKTYMKKAPYLLEPYGIEMKLVSWKKDGVTVDITNNSDESWLYGSLYNFHVLLDDEWYVVPLVEDVDIPAAEPAELQPGETHTKTYDFYGYGDFPKGVYRLMVQGLSVRSDGKESSDEKQVEYKVESWDTSKLREVSEPKTVENIDLKLISWENGTVKVKITNNTNEVLTFGEWFSLDVLLDGKWYNVPQAPGNWDRFENENVIVPQTSIIKGYYLDMFGKIPDGTYRIVTPNGAVTNEDDHPWEAELQDDELVSVCEYIPTICVDMKYATEDNFVGQVLYDHPYALLRYGTVKKLLEAEKKLNELGYRIKIWDAYRPVSAQEKLWEICPDPRYVSNPATGYLGHSRGNTIDLTIVDYDTLEEIEMPTGFDDFTAKADRDYGDVSKKAAENSALLEMVMTECGFTGYSGEWWHYSDTTEYPVIK